MVMMAQLTEDQKKIIEEKRQKALSLRAAKKQNAPVSSYSKPGAQTACQVMPQASSSSATTPASSSRPPGSANLRHSGDILSWPPVAVNMLQVVPAASKPQISGNISRLPVPGNLGPKTFTRAVAGNLPASSCIQQKTVANTPVSNLGSFYKKTDSRSSTLAFQKVNSSTTKSVSISESSLGSSMLPMSNTVVTKVSIGPPANSNFPTSSVRPGMSNINTSKTFSMEVNVERKRKARVQGKCVLVSRTRFEVQINYHPAVIQIFKSINSKFYDTNSRQWSFTLTDYAKLMQQVLVIEEVFVEPLPQPVIQCFKEQIDGKVVPERTIPEADLSCVDKKLVNTLMSFQRQGVNFGVWKKGRVLIADDMGLGKTIQAICLACYYRKDWPMLVVVPSSLRFSWKDQFLRWVPSLSPQDINVVVSGKDNCTSGTVNIISYDIMARCQQILQKKAFQIVIMDESHSLKNSKTARTKAALPILKKAQRMILLSGTPALSRPSELYVQVSTVDPKLFPTFREFGRRYCDGKEMQWGWDFTGSSNLEELQILLEERVMIRRLKKDVLNELPCKRREMVVLDPSSVSITKDMNTSQKLVDKLKGADRRGALLQYFHETCKAKVKAVREYVVELLENDHKFLVFAHHQEMMDEIENAVLAKKISYIRIDGKTLSEERNRLCGWFQVSDDVKIAILSITSANAGLNLTAASLVVFAELFWNPGILVQAEDRVHRLGQEDSVIIRYLVGTGTADDFIWPMVQRKLDILGKAGLSKDDFSTADTTTLKDPKQNDILSYFEESFFEEPEENTNTEATMCDKNANKTMVYTKDTAPKTPLSKSPRKQKLLPSPGQTTLFKYFSPGKDSSSSIDASNKAKKSLFLDTQSDEELAEKEIAAALQMSDELFDEEFAEEEPPVKKPKHS